MASKSIDVKSLITERILLANYNEIYSDMNNGRSIASILVYPEKKSDEPIRTIKLDSSEFSIGKGVVGIIGAGNFTSAMILPCLKKTKAKLKYISSSGGLTGTIMAKKYNIANTTTDNSSILNDNDVDLVMVTTRHNSHASLVIQALDHGKHVFVEKPLALNLTELDQIIDAIEKSNKTVTVGFNRRFAPLAVKMKNLLGNSGSPMNIIATMNAGFIPANVWVHDMKIGGGRIIGEACHFVDLISFLTNSKVVSVCMNAMGQHPMDNSDNATIMLKYENGTNAVINYFANGSKAYSKERVEVYHQERTLVMDNWRKLTGYGFKNFSSASSGQDKGHQSQFNLLIESVTKGGSQIIPIDQIINTTKASFAAIESLRNGTWVNI
jgi:predicted dehydrogenase